MRRETNRYVPNSPRWNVTKFDNGKYVVGLIKGKQAIERSARDKGDDSKAIMEAIMELLHKACEALMPRAHRV